MVVEDFFGEGEVLGVEDMMDFGVFVEEVFVGWREGGCVGEVVMRGGGSCGWLCEVLCEVGMEYGRLFVLLLVCDVFCGLYGEGWVIYFYGVFRVV